MAFAGVSGAVGAAGPLALLHGGAWAIPDTALANHQDGLAEAMAAAQSAFSDAVPAIDAATRIVAVLEGHGAFDAGCGAMLNRARRTLVLPASGPGAWAFTTPHMARGVATTTRTAMAIRRETPLDLRHPS